MRIVFLGTSDFAIPSLKALIKSGHDVRAVVSRPARPAGRGKKLRQPPVAEYARKNNLEIHQPEKLSSEYIEKLKSMKPDLMVSAAYGGWLPENLLDSSPLGVVNIHPSILPEYRGAAPVTRAILDGRKETGVSFMLTDSGWDTGPVIAVHTQEIFPADTSGSLEERLSVMAAKNIVSVIEGYSSGKLTPVKQSGKIIYAKKITTDETWLDWNKPAEYLEREVRAFQPSPGARTMYAGKLLKIITAGLSSYTAYPGVTVLGGDSLILGCGGESSLEIFTIQPASRRVMNVDEFLRGAGMETGDRFGRT